MKLLQALTNAASHGALKDGDYVVIKFHPGSEFAFPVFVSSDYQKAHQKVNSLLNPYYSRFNNAPSEAYYVVKKFYKKVLRPIAEDGEINWELAQSIDSKCEVIAYKPSDGRTDCAYIYRMIITSGIDEMDSRYHNFDRLVEKLEPCPDSCLHLLTLKEVCEENAKKLKSCQSCQNYHGESYNGNKFVCAMHPYGFEGDDCPDYTPGRSGLSFSIPFL